MLRRWTPRRADGVDAKAGEPAEEAVAGAADAASPTAKARRLVTKKRAALVVLVLLVAGLGAAYTNKERFSAQFADFSRQVIGDENTARLESWYFTLQDRVDKIKYRVFGGETNPFDQSQVLVQFVPQEPGRRVLIDLRVAPAPETHDLTIPDIFAPKPLTLPKTKPLRESLEAGEGVWSTAGLPRSSPEDMLMAKTFIRPDKSRPYALVGVLLADARRVRLHMVGGTVDPGGDRGVKGPGVVPKDDYANLLVAWNGGFKGPHGGFGMVADGKEYRPLRNGLASVAVYKDGTVRMGEWGKDLSWEDGMVGVRQNAVLLVDNCEVSKRVGEGNDTWGYVQVNSAEFITWRSAVGLTKDGHLLVAAGNSLSAESLAKALWAAGACTAMQLDINNPYVLMSTYFPQPDGSLRAERFMDSMPDGPGRFLKSQERDFMYLTLDESRFRRR
ncbi:MAG: phosphodiester glycosidase family protein [Dehalococcoidia bacterium]|nr:phosphodiester glycosidase family protein [Dehalococcoidia bacterium]